MFASEAEIGPCNSLSERRRIEISKNLPTDHSMKEHNLLLPRVVVHSSLSPNFPVGLARTNKARPNILSVNVANQNRKKYVNRLHYSEISGLTPTSPFDINNTQSHVHF